MNIDIEYTQVVDFKEKPDHSNGDQKLLQKAFQASVQSRRASAKVWRIERKEQIERYKSQALFPFHKLEALNIRQEPELDNRINQLVTLPGIPSTV